MDKNKKQELIGLIEKYAQVPQRRKPRNPVAPVSSVSRNHPAPKVTEKSFVGSPAIKTMQQAIQSFANEAVGYTVNKVPNAKNPKMVSMMVAHDDKRKDFNDFLAEQYSAGSSIHGEEFAPNTDATNKEDKKPTNIIELDNVIDGLRRIGPGSKETMPDGVWDFRTNNAVKNIWAFADALVRITEDFGGVIPNLSFKKSDLENLAKEIPNVKDPKSLPSQDLDKKAQIITSLINKLSSFYKSYYKYVVNHPAYADYIKKDKPIVTITTGGKDPGAIPKDLESETSNLNNFYLNNIDVPGAKGSIKIGNLSLGHIKDIESLQKFMFNFLGYNESEVNNPQIQNKVLNSILTHVDSVLSSSTTPGKV